jgi:hypothetical protein
MVTSSWTLYSFLNTLLGGGAHDKQAKGRKSNLVSNDFVNLHPILLAVVGFLCGYRE